MSKEFKKTFFTCLMAVLLVVSNLIGKKLTNFMDITIGVEFITLPFTFLCTLLIINYGNKKDAYRSILVASVIELLITISYTIAVNLGTQSLMPDQAIYVNQVFKVNELNILASVLAFILSHCLLIYIYENFKQFGKELYGLTIGLLGSLILNSVIYLGITLKDYEFIYIINMLLSNIIIDIIMIVIVTILFYILKERKREVLTIKEDNKKATIDLGIEEVINTKKDVKVNKSKTSKKGNNNTKKSTSKNQQQVKKSKERK